MVFDWTISLGAILTLTVLVLGGVGFFITIRERVDTMSNRMILIEVQMAKLVDILVVQGRAEERMNAIDLRLQSQGKRLDDIINRFNSYVDTALKH